MNTTINVNLLEFGLWLILVTAIWKNLPDEWTEELGTIVGIGIEIGFTLLYIWLAFNYDIQIVNNFFTLERKKLVKYFFIPTKSIIFI
jgi:hypothetical protein